MNEAKTKSYMPAWLPAFNKKVTNKVQGLWAPYIPPYLMILHVGRKSGNEYRNPVMGFKKNGKLYVNLLYGSDSQWVRNVVAAGGCEVIRGGKTFAVTNPEVIVRGEYDGDLPLATRAFAKDLGILILQPA
jgi:deazaflavin-dependent oxidoreductase (nitroreductase family)